MAVEDSIPKFTLEVKNSEGVELKSIDEYSYGHLSAVAIKQFSLKTDCKIYLDRTTFSGPFYQNFTT